MSGPLKDESIDGEAFNLTMARERSNRDDNHRRLFPIEKAKRLLDYKQQMEFMEGLKEVREWFLENWWNIEMNAES